MTSTDAMITHRQWTWAMAAAAAVAVAYLWFHDPAQSGFYPVCLFHQWTGYWCPGCGTTRAMHQLVHGHLLAALRMNPLAIIVAPLLAVLVFSNGLARRYPRLAGGTAIVLGVVAVIFGVLRNIPALAFLAPHV